MQAAVCLVLGVPQHKVAVKCKRTGGAFGGKERCALLSPYTRAVGTRSTPHLPQVFPGPDGGGGGARPGEAGQAGADQGGGHGHHRTQVPSHFNTS